MDFSKNGFFKNGFFKTILIFLSIIAQTVMLHKNQLLYASPPIPLIILKTLYPCA